MGDGGDAVVDTTGAGDAFIGGFLVGLVGGMTSKVTAAPLLHSITPRQII